METDTTVVQTLPNGLVLLVEPMSDVQSAAFSIMTPAGSIFEPAGRNGVATLLSDLVTRGAGERDSRALSQALDRLGVQRSESAGWNFITFGGATLAENLPAILELYADILLRPRLPEEEFEAAVSGFEQSLLAIEDDPQRKVFIELRRRTYRAPWGLPTEGSLDDLPQITPADVVGHYRRGFMPNGTIIGVAGNIDPDRIAQAVERLLGDWQRQPAPAVVPGDRGATYDHLPLESSQTHIGVAYDGAPYGHPDYYAAWAAVSILSGGSSARLFTEVRERRGLCYSVFASLNSLKDEGRVLAYAGATPERAQETLDVMLAEFRRLEEGIGEDELDRCKARAKSSLIMQQESTGARASSVARDWFHLQRVTTLDEVRRQIDSLTVPRVLEYVRAHPARDVTVVTIGPSPLEVR